MMAITRARRTVHLLMLAGACALCFGPGARSSAAADAVQPAPVSALTATGPAGDPLRSGQTGSVLSAPVSAATATGPAGDALRSGQTPTAIPAAPKSSAKAPLSIQPGERLTLARCIDIALEKNPVIRAASGAVNASASRVGQARSGYYPQISATGGYAKTNSPLDATNTTVDQYSAGVTATMNIFDFGRTWNQVTIQQLNASAAGEDLRSTRSALVLNVKQAYYGLLQAEKNRDVLQETVKQFEQHLSQAKAFFEIGIKSKFDVTKADVDLSNARLNLIRAGNSLKLARVGLNNVMGVSSAPDYAIEDTLVFRKSTLTYDEVLQKASANRPDLRSLMARREASEESVSLARKGYLPTLSGNANYQRIGDTAPPDKTGWSAGLLLTIPLFSGLQTNYQVKEAKENLIIQQANEETLRQSILLEVQQAYLNLQEAEELVSVAELTVEQAQENFEIAQGRYAAGVGSPIEETDALVALSNAKTSLISALSGYRLAEASLFKAMGE